MSLKKSSQIMRPVVTLFTMNLILGVKVNAQTNTFPASGNVGISTTTPKATLSLGSSAATKKLAIYDDGTEMSGLGQEPYQLRLFFPNTNWNHLAIGSYGASTNSFTELMRVTQEGKVGIGTSTPIQKLDVRNGFISTRDADGYGGAFMQGGNGVAYLGALGTDRIVIGNASNREIVNILNSGSVGIGTADPKSYKLAVGGGDIKSYNYDSNTGITIGAESSERPRIGFHVSDNNRRFKIEFNGVNSPQERLSIFTQNGGAWPETEVFTVGKTGNIGIGTISPTTKLHVQGENVSNSNQGVLDIYSFGSNAALKIGLNTEYAWIQSHNSRPLRINELGNDVYINANGGNVGIGTNNTGSYKLAVEGKIGARKLVVTQVASWADYVFEPTYRLPSLAEVEVFIKTNKHLPDVPSAKEVATNGLDLGDNQAVLLKKIEEQMLYILDLNKKQEALLKKIEALELQLSNKSNKNN